jgi:hypothetical protein
MTKYPNANIHGLYRNRVRCAGVHEGGFKSRYRNCFVHEGGSSPGMILVDCDSN